MDTRKEYHLLVQDVRHFLQSSLPKKKVPLEIKKPQTASHSSSSIEIEETKQQEPSHSMKVNPSIHEKNIEEVLLPETVVVSSKLQPSKETSISCGSFTLETKQSSPYIDLSLIRESIQKILPPQILCISLRKESLSFLNKVALALIKHGISCNTLPLEINNEETIREFLSRSSATTFITEYEPLFTKVCAVPEPIEFHKYFFFSDKKCILFLHPAHSYEENILQKRDLWNNLKTLLPQSLSTSP
jgi:hypothetical protein